MLVPAVMLVFALMLQPVCLCYSRSVMRAAAAETARAAVTAYHADMASCEAYARRRLQAVPEVPLFHVGGPDDWKVRVSCVGNRADVQIVGHARPLPLMGALASAAWKRDGTGIVLEAKLSVEGRPHWLGGDYDAWQTVWG